MAHPGPRRADHLRPWRQPGSRGVRVQAPRSVEPEGFHRRSILMTLSVLEPGLCTLVVDFGRPRTRSLGVPVGGAADRSALAIGNALVGNEPDAAALEISLAGPTLQA